MWHESDYQSVQGVGKEERERSTGDGFPCQTVSSQTAG